MNVNIILGAEGAYACINTTSVSLDVRLAPGRSAQKALREAASELREEAARKARRAELIEQAAAQLEREEALKCLSHQARAALADRPIFNDERAIAEGWVIADTGNSSSGPWQIQRLDEDSVFPWDEDAWTHVAGMARLGSSYHVSALKFIEQCNPGEYTAIVKKTGVSLP